MTVFLLVFAGGCVFTGLCACGVVMLRRLLHGPAIPQMTLHEYDESPSQATTGAEAHQI